MEFHGIDEFMRYLKAKFDESERRQNWRALTGRDHVRSGNDTFIFTDRSVYQIKSVEIVPKKMVAVAREVGGPSPDMLELVKGGAPVPLNVVSASPSAYSVVMFGMQQYSSDIAELLRKEYYSSKQEQLQAELDRKLKVLLERPDLRTSYRKLRESQEGYFA
jgi:hypothetical protein